MTVGQLIDKLKCFPNDLPVATIDDISWVDKDDPNFIKVELRTWSHSNYPYDKPDFDYVNLE